MQVDWDSLWNTVFGCTEWLGLSMGFWVALGICLILVVIQNVVFWCCFKPGNKYAPKTAAERSEEEAEQQ